MDATLHPGHVNKPSGNTFDLPEVLKEPHLEHVKVMELRENLTEFKFDL